MDDLLADALPKLTLAVTTHPFLGSALMMLTAAKAGWDAGMTALVNKEAAQLGATMLMDNFLASVTRKPSSEENSLIETWDNSIRAQVAYQGSVYKTLLPNNRETLTAGGTKDRLDAGSDFALRLGLQTTKPALVTLGTTVGVFYNQGQSLRSAQLTLINQVSVLRDTQEVLRKTAADVLYAMVGYAMVEWRATPLLVDSLFDVNLMRSTPQVVPGAPVDVAWNPGSRTLSTTVLPVGATRLDAWRLGPGGTPELLATGEFGSNEVMIPASVTWDSGDLYQLWLVAKNSKGTSLPGPSASWTAP